MSVVDNGKRPVENDGFYMKNASLNEKLTSNISKGISDGLILLDFQGTIRYANSMSAEILGLDEDSMIGSKLVRDYLLQPENDMFMQAVIDTIYQQNAMQTRFVTYQAGGKKRYLRMRSSLYTGLGGEKYGMIIILSDLSDLVELQDSLKAMERINELNRQLNARNELLSKTFGQYLSDEIVRELLDTPGGLEPGGKRRDVSIMMSDLRGFTAMSERINPDDLIRMLNHYLEVMTDAIQKRGGTIIEFIGDGILAIFGAPRSSETHAEDALAAALEMQLSMEEINRWNAERNYPYLEMGIGLNCGEVIVGNIGSEKRMKYGVVGSDVNLCGRIESYTLGGQVLISPVMREKIGVPLEIEKEMMVIPKGADREMLLSQVIGIGAPYDVHINLHKDHSERLKNPVPVCFYRIDGKHTSDKACYGGIVALGDDCAVLETETDLELFDNLQINLGGKLLCKISEQDGNEYLVRYTSIPYGYGKWVKNNT